MLTPELIAVVLAAGKGTRMKSELPKVLVPVLNRPMIEYLLDSLQAAGVGKVIVVVGYRAADVQATLAHRANLVFVEQTEQLGTGHAVMTARAELAKHPQAAVLVVAGDSPMTRADSLQTLLAKFQELRPACLLGTARRDNPTGLGRIVRDARGGFVGIVEEKDASPEQQAITEVNMSAYLFQSAELVNALAQLGNSNAQKEYYLTDVPGIMLKRGLKVLALDVLQPSESLSINTPEELKIVEAEMQRQRGGAD